MNFCSACGGRVERKPTGCDGQIRYVCARCDSVHYDNPRVIVCCAVCLRDKVLMCRRAEEPGAGQWAVPAGYLEIGESLEQGAARETREETGLIVDPARLELCSVVNMTAIQQIAIMFRVILDSEPDLVPGPECSEVAFKSIYELSEPSFAWRATMGDGPERFHRELISGEFTIQLITIGAPDGSGFRSREYKVASIHETLLPLAQPQQ
jgi:ADP-ribose pyrophosphatase YjhB (NUDIX family)